MVLIHGNALEPLIEAFAVQGEERLEVLGSPSLAKENRLFVGDVQHKRCVLVALEDGKLIHQRLWPSPPQARG